MVLRSGYLAVAEALQLQEASGMMHSDVARRLDSAVRDAHKGTGNWASYITHNGDGTSGDCIYNCDSKTMSAPYEIGTLGGKDTTHVDTDNAEEVVPTVSYMSKADDDDQYSAMEESYKRDGLYSELPLYERFIGKAERAGMSDEDFAGKGKSFPISQPSDIMAAVHSMGRAGDKNVGTSTLKSRIIAIAKRKGWTKYLPKAWQGGDTTTSAESRQSSDKTGQLKLVESIAFPLDIELREAFSVGSKIKLIAPGPGASAYYTEAALKQAAVDKIFHAGLPMRIDHPTKQEEAARPEGSVKDWGAVLAKDAEWLESYVGKDGKDSGKGLYSEIKPFSDHAQTIQEKGPYAGVSIRANGSALTEAGRTVMKDGRVVLARFTSAEGADMVTRAGAGGMFLSESARAANQQEVEMTEAEVLRLLEAERSKWESESTAKTLRVLEARALRGDAMVAAARICAPLQMREGLKQLAVDTVLRLDLPVKEGLLDETKFGELLTSELKRVAEAAGEFAGVKHLGLTTEVEEIDEKKRLKEAKRQRELDELQHEESVSIFESLGMPKDAAEFAAKGRAA